MENPKYHLKGYCLTALLFFACSVTGFSQSPTLTIDYDPIVCIENNDDRCLTYVPITVDASNFCSGLEIVHDSPLASGEDPSALYFAGSYNFEVRASDECGNSITQTVAFEVVDCKPPTAICTYGMSLELNIDCTVELMAEELNANSEDNCSRIDDLQLEVARVSPDHQIVDRANSIVFEADDVTNQRVALIAVDEAGNEAICETVVQVECGTCQSACNDTTREERIIQGSFYTVGGYPMQDVDLILGRQVLGTFDSPFRFDLNAIDSSGGVGILIGDICSEKIDDLRNGVSTIDLVMIRQNILQLSTFNIYQNIAADVNGSESVTAYDMLQIRRLILRTIDKLVGVPSWRFFRSDFDLGAFDPDFSDPIGFYEDAFCYSVNLMSPNSNTYDFLGLKMGDVSGDAGEDWARSGDPIGFNTENKVLNEGSVVDIPFNTNTQDLLGYQMTIEFDADALELLRWSGELEDYNINTLQAEDGLLAISKVTEGSRSNERFNLTFAVKENAILSEVIRLSDKITSTEGYTDFQSRRPIHLKFNENENQTGLTIYPNPMEDRLVLEFEATTPGDYQLELFNTQGQLVYSEKWSVFTGENRRILQREELNAASGWYLARISGPQGTETASIILK